MTDLEKAQISIKKFDELEKRFRSVIAKCNRKNLVDQKENIVNHYGVENATIVEHYILDNGLHVYRLLNGEQPICYWISSSALYVESMHGGNTKYTGAPAFEYSIGGNGNSLPIDVLDYTVSKHISVVFDRQERYGYGGRMQTDIMAVPGHTLSGPVGAQFTDYEYQRADCDYLNRYGKSQELYDTGDLFEYIKNSNPHYDEDVKVLSGLKDIIKKVEQLSLDDVKDQESSKDKKGFLKKLLGKNKILDSELDAFRINNGRKR